MEGFYENSWGPKASIPLLTFIPSACPLFHPTVPFLSSRSLYSHRPASPFTAANRPPRSFSLYKQQSLPLLSTNQSIPRVLPRNETSRNRCSSLCEFETFLVFAIFLKPSILNHNCGNSARNVVSCPIILETGGWIYHGKFRKYVDLIRISSDQQCFLSSKVIFIFPRERGRKKYLQMYYY